VTVNVNIHLPKQQCWLGCGTWCFWGALEIAHGPWWSCRDFKACDVSAWNQNRATSEGELSFELVAPDMTKTL